MKSGLLFVIMKIGSWIKVDRSIFRFKKERFIWILNMLLNRNLYTLSVLALEILVFALFGLNTKRIKHGKLQYSLKN